MLELGQDAEHLRRLEGTGAKPSFLARFDAKQRNCRRGFPMLEMVALEKFCFFRIANVKYG